MISWWQILVIATGPVTVFAGFVLYIIRQAEKRMELKTEISSIAAIVEKTATKESVELLKEVVAKTADEKLMLEKFANIDRQFSTVNDNIKELTKVIDDKK